MKILSADQLRTIDQASGDTLTLMENAGTRLVETLEDRFENLDDLEIYVLCGKGNNGGDGFVIARLLLERGCSPHVLLLAAESEIKGDAAVNLARLKSAGEFPTVILNEAQWAEVSVEEAPALVIDALLGTGVTRPVDGLYQAVIESLPDLFPDGTILAVDVPSGLSADSAEVPGPAVQADITVTFTALKRCLVFPPAHKYAGDIVVAVAGTSLGSSTELQRRMVEDAIGRRVEITVWRNGALVDVIAVPRELTESAS